jgi:hypothetical protein
MFLHANCHSGGRGAPQAHLKAGGSNRSIMKCGIAKLTNAINATQGAIDRILLSHVLITISPNRIDALS